MNYVARFFRKMWILVRREKFRDELAEEMAFHREHAEQEFQADGMPSEAARYAARRQFGNAAQILEQSQDVVSFGFETALQDFSICHPAVAQKSRICRNRDPRAGAWHRRRRGHFWICGCRSSQAFALSESIPARRSV